MTETSDVNCLSLSQALCLILNFVFQGIWLDDVMAWVEAHLEEKLASAGSNTRVQSAGCVRAIEEGIVRQVLIKNLAIFFLFSSKFFLPISLKIQLLVILCNI
jgi:hypothetical protein